MGALARLAVSAAAIGAGAAAGYLAERAALRGRLDVPEPAGPALGSIAGEVTHVDGPDGTALFVESYGPPDAVQVVLAHGWVNTGRVWHEQVVGLDHLRLVTYDQPGHGRSSPPLSGSYDLDLFGDALLAVLEQATRPGPIVLVGHSLGGMSILNVARRAPDLVDRRIRGVVLASTTSVARPDDVAFGMGIHALARLERGIGRAIPALRPHAAAFGARVPRASTDLSYLVTRRFALAPAADPRYVDFTEQLMLDSDLDMVAGVLPSVLRLDEDEALACLTVPTVVLCGADDRLTPIALSRRIASRCVDASLVELPGVGHMTPLEAHEVLNALVADLADRAAEEAA